MPFTGVLYRHGHKSFERFGTWPRQRLSQHCRAHDQCTFNCILVESTSLPANGESLQAEKRLCNRCFVIGKRPSLISRPHPSRFLLVDHHYCAETSFYAYFLFIHNCAHLLIEIGAGSTSIDRLKVPSNTQSLAHWNHWLFSTRDLAAR
jgi:hypothetical protein